MNNLITEIEPTIAILPVGYSVGRLYPAIPTGSLINVEFSRSIEANRIDELGEVISVPPNIPRIDFNSSSGECRGILVGGDDVITISSASTFIGDTMGTIIYQGDFTIPTDIHILGNDITITDEVIKIQYTTASIQFYSNDELISTKTGSFVWSGMNRIDLGNYMGNSNADCHIKKFIITKNG